MKNVLIALLLFCALNAFSDSGAHKLWNETYNENERWAALHGILIGSVISYGSSSGLLSSSVKGKISVEQAAEGIDYFLRFLNEIDIEELNKTVSDQFENYRNDDTMSFTNVIEIALYVMFSEWSTENN